MFMTPEDLKQWRTKNRYTQAKLAKALDTHVITVSRWENAAREIPSFLHLALDALEYKAEEVKRIGEQEKEDDHA
jgi:transcriptional regulator with XRE-family HTH domain